MFQIFSWAHIHCTADEELALLISVAPTLQTLIYVDMNKPQENAFAELQPLVV